MHRGESNVALVLGSKSDQQFCGGTREVSKGSGLVLLVQFTPILLCSGFVGWEWGNN